MNLADLAGRFRQDEEKRVQRQYRTVTKDSGQLNLAARVDRTLLCKLALWSTVLLFCWLGWFCWYNHFNWSYIWPELVFWVQTFFIGFFAILSVPIFFLLAPYIALFCVALNVMNGKNPFTDK